MKKKFNAASFHAGAMAASTSLLVGFILFSVWDMLEMMGLMIVSLLSVAFILMIMGRRK